MRARRYPDARAAPISTMRSVAGSNPVVSRSIAMRSRTIRSSRPDQAEVSTRSVGWELRVRAQPAYDGMEHRDRESGVLVEDVLELPRRQDQASDRALCDDGR